MLFPMRNNYGPDQTPQMRRVSGVARSPDERLVIALLITAATIVCLPLLTVSSLIENMRRLEGTKYVSAQPIMIIVRIWRIYFVANAR